MNPVPDPSIAVGFIDIGLYSPGGLDIPEGLLGFQDCKWLWGSLPTVTVRVAYETGKLKAYDKTSGDELPETDLTGQAVSFMAFGQ